MQSFDWADFYAHFEGEAFFNWFRSQLSVTSSPTSPDSAPRDAMGFDAVLIDSRTGVTEMGGVCTRQLADVIVSFCAPNDQNLYGVAAMSESFLREDLRHIRGGRLPEVLVVPARVDLAGETTEQNIFHSLFDEQLKPPPTFQRLGLKMWDALIPYVVKYAYRESMAIGARDSNPIMEKAYSELTTRLVLFAGPESNLQKYFASDLLQLRRSSGLGALEPALSPTEELMVKISSVFASLTIQEQTMAKRVVTRLVTPTGMRLSTALDDFEPAERDIAQRLADAGLLTIKTSHKSGETTIELAHDILIQQWSTLQQWLAEDREFLIWRQQLRSALAAWEQTGRDRDALLPQTLASQAASWMSRRPDDLNTKERKFISGSVERHQRFTGGRLFQRFVSSPFFVTGSLLYIAALGTVIANLSGIKGTSARAIIWGTVGGSIMSLVRRVGVQTTGSPDSRSSLWQLTTELMNAVAGGVLVASYQVFMKTQVPALLAFNLGALGSLGLRFAATTLSKIEGPTSKYTKNA